MEDCSHLTLAFTGLVEGCVYMCQVIFWNAAGIEHIHTDSALTVSQCGWDGGGVTVISLPSSLQPIHSLVKIWDVNGFSALELDDALLASKSLTTPLCTPSMRNISVAQNSVKERPEGVKCVKKRPKVMIQMQDLLAVRLKYIRVGFPNHWCTSGHANASSQDYGQSRPSFDLHTPCPPDHPGPMGIDKCSQLFVNIGTWLFVSDWNLSAYALGLEQLLSQLVAFSDRQNHHVPIVFLGSPLHPINDDMLKCPLFSPHSKNGHWRNTRFPHLVMQYNAVAHKVVDDTKRNGNRSVTFLHTHRSVLPLFDLSFDGTHYQVFKCLSVPSLPSPHGPFQIQFKLMLLLLHHVQYSTSLAGRFTRILLNLRFRCAIIVFIICMHVCAIGMHVL